MAERINIDIDLIENGGHGLYAFNPGDGIYICEERPDQTPYIDGDYLKYDTNEDNTVLMTHVNDDGNVEIIEAETLRHHIDIHDEDIENNMIRLDVLKEYDLIMLDLIN